MKNKIYFTLNLLIISIAILFLGFLIAQSDVLYLSFSNFNIFYVLIAFIGTAIVNIFKFIRLYLIMMEKRIALSRFIRTYIKTTLVTLVFPYKLGDLFRIYSYGHDMDDYKSSFLAIFIDRYFDSIALLLMVLPVTIYFNQSLSLITFIIILFTMTLTIFFLMFPNSYKYFNRFFLYHTSSNKSLKMLKLLDSVNEWHTYAITMIRGRALLMFIISCLSWGAEYAVLFSLSKISNVHFSARDFVAYLNSIFIGNNSVMKSMYVYIGSLIFGILVVTLYSKNYLRMKGTDINE